MHTYSGPPNGLCTARRTGGGLCGLPEESHPAALTDVAPIPYEHGRTDEQSPGLVVTRAADGFQARGPDTVTSTEVMHAAAEIAGLLIPLAGGGEPTTFQEAILWEVAAEWVVLMRKRVQRGVDNLVQQGQAGIVDRMIGDKGQRLLRQAKLERLRAETLAEGMPQDMVDQFLKLPSGDSMDDDIRDMANYSQLLLLLRSGRLELPYVGRQY